MLDNESGLTEETARAMRAVASTVTDAPPLRLAPRPGYRAARPAPRRRWQRWGVPLAAALTVIAVAVALVTARDASPRRVAPPASPAPTVDGVPAYYAALVTAGSAQTAPEQIAIGETVTGKRIATVAPPAGTTFTGVTGAADDRTFVVDAQPGSLDAESEPFAPRTWYLLRISPGAADPAQLTRLPIPATAPGTDVAAVALSPDGTELAVGLQPNALNDPGGPVYLRVYSVASGAVLHSWSSVGGGVLADGQLFGGPKYAGPDPNLALAWIGQQGLAFGYRRGVPGKTIDGSQVSSLQVTLAQIRFIALSAKDDGDLVADEGVRHRVAGRSESDTREPVHLPNDGLCDRGSERRQRPEQLAFDVQSFRGNRCDLRVNVGVHLGTPRPTLSVGADEVANGELLWNHQVGLHVANEVLDDPLRLRVRTFAEVRREAVVRGEADVGRCRDDDAGDRATF